MAIIILTHGISGGSGIDKAVISVANLFAKYSEDTKLYTINGKIDGNKFTQPSSFYLDKNVAVNSLLNIKIDNPNYGDKLKTQTEINQKFFRQKYSIFHGKQYKKFAESLEEDDIVIFASPIVASVFKDSRCKFKCKTILQIHGNFEQDVDNFKLMMNSLSIIDYIQPVSKQMIPFLQKVSGFTDEKIKYIPNILDLEDELPVISPTNSELFRVAIIGSLQDRKNQIDAVKMINEIKEKKIVLQIFGNDDNDYSQSVKDLAASLNISDRVIFMGFHPEVFIYENSDLVISTAKSEGFGYTLLEAGKYGLPVCTYKYEYGSEDIIEDGINGYLAEQGDYKTLAKQVETLYNSKELCKEFGENGKKLFMKNFNYKNTYKLYKEISPLSNSKSHESLFFEGSDLELPLNFEIEYKPKRLKKFTSHKIIIKDFNLPIKECVFKKYRRDNSKIVKVKKNGNDLVIIHSNINRYVNNTIFTITYEGQETLLFRINHQNKYLNMSQDRQQFYKKKVMWYGNTLNTLILSNVKNLPVYKIMSEDGLNLKFKNELHKFNGVFIPAISISNPTQKMKVIYYGGEVEDFNYVEHGVYDIDLKSSYFEVKEHVYKFMEKYKSTYIDNVNIYAILLPALEIESMKINLLWNEPFSTSNAFDRELKHVNEFVGNDKLFINFKKNDHKFDTFISKNTDYVCFDYGSYDYLEKNNCNVAFLSLSSYKIKRIILEDSKLINEVALDIQKNLIPLGIGYCENIISFRIKKHIAEYNYWYDILKNNGYKEVLIASSVWNSGLIQACKELEITVSDVQYALVTNNHLNYGIKYTDNQYSVDKMYLFGNFWEQENKFAPSFETFVSSIGLKNLEKKEEVDFLIISQHLLSGQLVMYANNLYRKFPNSRIVYALHPSENIDFVSSNLEKGIEISNSHTSNLIASSIICIGVFSTSLYEAVYLGKNVFVINLPGYETIEEEKSRKIFNFIDINDFDFNKFEHKRITEEIFRDE